VADTMPSNRDIAGILTQIADLLEAQDANPFRVRAYRKGAQTVREAPNSLAQVVREAGADELKKLPNIGDKQARLIAEYVYTGRSNLLDRLQGEVSPEDVFARVPGIGEELAERIATKLDIDTLEQLEMAAHDGRLAAVEGFGPKRLQAVRSSLAGMLSPSAQRRARRRVRGEAADHKEGERPPVALLLALDADYRRRAEQDDLHKIAPKRFNPDNEAWLPIMHSERQGWDFTVLFSNTARAHDLNKTRDWVVIYYDRDGDEHQNTIVTETSGPLAGRRVVRGREAECRRYYDVGSGSVSD
jgi:DNA polymerase (family 10)